MAPPSHQRLQGLERRYTSDDKQKFYETFRHNLQQIVKRAQDRRVPILLCTIAYNYAVPPQCAESFNSYADVAQMSEEQLQESLRTHPDNAFLQYALGLKSARQGNFAEGSRLIDLAFLHTTRPYRANTEINRIMAEVAASAQVPLADVRASVASHFPSGMPDAKAFSDHCHLNPAGNAILQQTIAAAILERIEKESPSPQN